MVSELQRNEEPTSPLEEQARRVLQTSAEQLDGRTRSRLTQARYAAVSAANRPRVRAWHWLAPLSGTAATAVIVAMLVANPLRHRGEPMTLIAADELEIVTSEDTLDFYRDVEFYAWLDSVLDDAPTEDSGA